MFKSIFLLFLLLFLLNCQSLTQLNTNPPEIIFMQDKYAISPNNDGIMDNCVIKFTIKDQGVIRYWKFTISNKDGKIVRTYQSETTIEEEQKRLIPSNKPIGVPNNIVWYGEDDSNKIVPDGEYTFSMIAMDNSKNITPQDKFKGIIIVKTDKPEMHSAIDDNIFSPNGDGNKDLIKINIDIIKDKVDSVTTKVTDLNNFVQKWYVDILDSTNKVVRKYVFDEKGKKEILWDGKDDKGNLVPDGIYKLHMYSTDIAGNTFDTNVPETIIKDMTVTPIDIKMDDHIFSPNTASAKNIIKFNFIIPVKDNIVSWNFSILNPVNQQIIKSISGNTAPVDEFVWDGKDNAGKKAPDGTYKAKLTVEYRNGNKPSKDSDQFSINTVPPKASVSLSANIFSPGSNSKLTEINIIQTSSKEDTKWIGTIYDIGNKPVKTFSWDKETPKTAPWDGKDNNGKLLPDGQYYYQLTCTNLAGNSFTSDKYFTKIYTKDTPLFILASFPSFSPNNDNVLDIEPFEIKFNLSPDNIVISWKIAIENDNGKQINSFEKNGDLPATFEWDGKTSDKKVAPDGAYRAELDVTFKAGNVSKANTKSFLLDTTPPEISYNKNMKYFAPSSGNLEMELAINDISGIKNWQFTIMNTENTKEFISFSGEGAPKDKLIWDGKSKDGEMVESAEDYPVVISAEDNAGNKIKKSVQPITIDILVEKLPDGRYKIKVSNIHFKPDSPVMLDTPKNTEILDLLGNALEKFPTHKIKLEGFASKYTEGLSDRVAKKLSEQRGETVAKELNKRGIDLARISVEGKGFDNPIVPYKPNMTKDEIESLAKNRRVEFYLEKQQ